MKDTCAGPQRHQPRIDAHTHGFPDRLAQAVRNFLNRAGGLRGGVLLDDLAGLVAAEGFDAAWLLPYAHREGVAESINEWSAERARQFPQLILGATFHPADANLPALVQRGLVDLRLRVVKLHCSVGGFSADDPRLQPLWEAAASLRVPVVIHAGRHSPGETAIEEIDVVVPVLRGHPHLRLVLAHAGHPNTPRALELMTEYDNLYADVTPVWDRTVQVSPNHLSAFAGRFLFGSDAPNNPVSPSEQAARFGALGLTEEALGLLMGGAAERLVSLETADRH